MNWIFLILMSCIFTFLFLLGVFIVGGLVHQLKPNEINSVCDDNGQCYKLNFDINKYGVIN